MKRPIATLDLETDPFEPGAVPEPFLSGFYDGSKFVSFWGDPINRMVKYLSKLPPHIIYWHNGGKFDVFWFLDKLSPDLRIVNGRIIQCWIGEHEVRDSYAIMPFPLEEYQKTSIDYKKLHRDRREQNRDEIVSYLRDDCVFLYELCDGFVKEFGDGLTIGGTGMRELKKYHKFAQSGPGFDEKFRKDFYFGGRNQVFRSGIIEGPINVYDVNSMYSFAMSEFLHPIGTQFEVSPRVEKNTCFVVAEGRNYGAFPVRRENNSLDFTVKSGTFSTTIHEWNAALETGTFRPKKVLKTFGFADRSSFQEFVYHFYDSRGKNKAIVAEAKKRNEQAREAAQRVMFYKYVLNAPYGKFAQNPANYAEWKILPFGVIPPFEPTCPVHSLKTTADELLCQCWAPAHVHQGKYIIWSRPTIRKNYYNVCTGASITGAARAVLLRGLSRATNPYYCDTDSIIAESLSGVDISDTRLGSWKLEATGNFAAIAGKKLYGIFDRTASKTITCKDCPQKSELCKTICGCIKKAHKGARLTGQEIVRIAQGETIEYANPVPKFKFDGSHIFVTRHIRRTSNV